jgi:predicted small lipoprotein YifL
MIFRFEIPELTSMPLSMRAFRLLLAGLILSACGTKGPLVLPPNASPAPKASTQPSSLSNSADGSKSSGAETKPGRDE